MTLDQLERAEAAVDRYLRQVQPRVGIELDVFDKTNQRAVRIRFSALRAGKE